MKSGAFHLYGAMALALVCASTTAPAAAVTTSLSPSDETRAACVLLHQGRFDAASGSVHEVSVDRPLAPEGPLFEALTTWWRLLDKPKDPGLLKVLDERLQETVKRSELLLGGPDAQRGRIFAGTALVLIAQSRAI